MENSTAPVEKMSWWERCKKYVEYLERNEADIVWDHIRHLSQEVDRLNERMDKVAR